MYKIVLAERQDRPKEMITKTAVNHRKTAYSGHFGTPGETRTHYIPLRSMAYRFVQCPFHNFPCYLVLNDIAWLLVNLHKNPCNAAS